MNFHAFSWRFSREVAGYRPLKSSRGGLQEQLGPESKHLQFPELEHELAEATEEAPS